jgi:hypothetical protein
MNRIEFSVHVSQVLATRLHNSQPHSGPKGTRVEREVLIGGTSDVCVEDMAGVQSFWWAYNAEE